jgi:cytochrome c
VFLSVLAASLAFTGSALADGNADKGKRVFNLCKACHRLEAGKNGVGPSLHGLFGRKAGTVAGFNYSGAMKNSGIVWNEKSLDNYLAKPRDVVKGTKMVFPGLKKEDQREDVIAYLKQATK